MGTLFEVFSRYGKVERAWLQFGNGSASRWQHGKNHRGFGFVVLANESSVDGLLRQRLKTYVDVGNGVHLVIKHAKERTRGRGIHSFNSTSNDESLQLCTAEALDYQSEQTQD